jgi:hypothetical protein
LSEPQIKLGLLKLKGGSKKQRKIQRARIYDPKIRKPLGLALNIILKIGDFGLHFFFPKIQTYQEGRGKNEDCKKNLK